MNFVRLLPVIVSAILMAAHLLWHGMIPLVVLSLAFPAILLIRRPWVVRVVQVALCLVACEWIRTAIWLAHRRLASGAPWTRMAVILGVVAIVTGASALVFRSPSLRRRYRLGSP